MFAVRVTSPVVTVETDPLTGEVILVTVDRELARALVPLLAPVPPDDGPGIVARARAVIAERLGDRRPTVGGVARTLGMSARALQRSFTDAGTSFREELDDARRQRARSYLATTSLTAAEIAGLLGFAEPTSFYRAFRTWTGMSPGAFRDVQGNATRPAIASRNPRGSKIHIPSTASSPRIAQNPSPPLPLR
jgi:AraC-like DNA-binding protein